MADGWAAEQLDQWRLPVFAVLIDGGENENRGAVMLRAATYGRYTAELVSVSQTFTCERRIGTSVDRPAVIRS
jgi:hypothetical protein